MVDLSRIVGGVDGAKLINDMNDQRATPPAGQQDWRVGATEGDLVTVCNKDYDANTTLAKDDPPASPRRPRSRATRTARSP